jgi:hypothetical protein
MKMEAAKYSQDQLGARAKDQSQYNLIFQDEGHYSCLLQE